MHTEKYRFYKQISKVMMEILDSGTLCSALNNSAFLSNHLLTATSSGLGYARRRHSTKQ